VRRSPHEADPEPGQAPHASGPQPARAQLEAWYRRGLSAATLALVAATAGVVLLCLPGPQPAALAVPLALASISFLLGAASAALFAWVAYLQLEDGDPGSDDDGGGPGGGRDEPPEPPGGGDLELDWDRFERDFRSHCERVAAAVA
jgi:hypothetical protein